MIEVTWEAERTQWPWVMYFCRACLSNDEENGVSVFASWERVVGPMQAGADLCDHVPVRVSRKLGVFGPSRVVLICGDCGEDLDSGPPTKVGWWDRTRRRRLA